MSKKEPSSQDILHDPQRLAIIHNLELLDTPTEEGFDRLTELAQQILDVPVSLVSILDTDRQFFKGFCGLDEPWATRQEIPLSHSFCQHVVISGQPLIIGDARETPLVRDNLGIRDLKIIAYLGIPLTTENGDRLGSFCVIDHQPRQWTEQEVSVVRQLAMSTMTEIDLRQEMTTRQEAEANLKAANGQLARLQEFCADIIAYMLEAVQEDTPRDEMLSYLHQAQAELAGYED